MKIIEIADKIHTKCTEKNRREKLAELFFRSVSLHFNEDIILTSQIHGETGAALKEHHVGKGIFVSPSWQQLATTRFSTEPSNEMSQHESHVFVRRGTMQTESTLPPIIMFFRGKWGVSPI